MAKNKPKFNHQLPKNKGFNHNPKQEGKILMPDHKHPVFCFKYLQKGHDLEECTDDEKQAFLGQIVNLSKLTWDEIAGTQRHGMGSEKINRTSIKPTCPKFITDDVDFLLSLRFQGKKPFLVHRDRFICHVIFIDNKFNVYNHG